MPIEGRFYSNKELQEILGLSKQRISDIARQQSWLAIQPGLYCSEDVEDYLEYRDVDLDTLPIRSYQFPDGAALTEIIEANSI